MSVAPTPSSLRLTHSLAGSLACSLTHSLTHSLTIALAHRGTLIFVRALTGRISQTPRDSLSFDRSVSLSLSLSLTFLHSRTYQNWPCQGSLDAWALPFGVSLRCNVSGGVRVRSGEPESSRPMLRWSGVMNRRWCKWMVGRCMGCRSKRWRGGSRARTGRQCSSRSGQSCDNGTLRLSETVLRRGCAISTVVALR
eukprot:1459015-Rhodomonas_salina.1